jgi:hypothetical protein
MPKSNTCEFLVNNKPCGGLLLEEAEVKLESIPESPDVKGENGLGIIVMDMSGSMDEKAFPQKANYDITKSAVISSALSTSIVNIRNINNSAKAYVAIIGFTSEAKLLGIFKASEINEDVSFWNKWFADKIEDVRNTCGGGTNITSALRLSRQIYDAALKGDLSSYGIKDFKPMYQHVNIKSRIYDIANVRVFIYSDGAHYANEPLSNAFDDASLIPGESNITGITAAYLGNIEDAGYETMRNIAGVCPKHEKKTVIHVNDPKAYIFLRDLFHMTSATSGFCIQCAPTQQINL